MSLFKHFIPSQRSKYIEQVARHWDEKMHGPAPISSWWKCPAIMAEVNKRVSGSPERDFLDLIKEKYFPNPVARVLSLGSGTGDLERKISKLQIAHEIDAIDISKERIAHAVQKARESGIRNISYFAGDVVAAPLRHRYDAIFCRHILHHIRELETLFEKIGSHLVAGGLMFVDDFIGPTRFQWTEAQLHFINGILRVLPDNYKKDLRNPGRVQYEVVRPQTLDDPSEAVRSSEIIPVMERYFKIIFRRDYGGTIFHMLFKAHDVFL